MCTALPGCYAPGVYLQGESDVMSDRYQVGFMISTLKLWQGVLFEFCWVLFEFVQLLLTKQLTASEAQSHPWIISARQV